MPTQLTPRTQELMTDPYGAILKGMPEWAKILASMILPNPQAPYGFGSIGEIPKGIFGSALGMLTTKGGTRPVTGLEKSLHEFLSTLHKTGAAREGVFPGRSTPYLNLSKKNIPQKVLNQVQRGRTKEFKGYEYTPTDTTGLPVEGQNVVGGVPGMEWRTMLESLLTQGYDR